MSATRNVESIKINGKTIMLHRKIGHYFFVASVSRISRMSIGFELSIVAVLGAGVLFLFQGILLETVSWRTDSVLWYGMFHYFAESLMSGSWPYWNSYVHGGEPFFYAWNVIRLSDPVTLALICFSAPFNPDLYSLYHCNFILRILVASVGAYLFLRVLLTRTISLILASVLAIWGPLVFQSLAIIGDLDSYSWFPWILWCVIKLFRIEPGLANCNHVRRKWIILASWFFAIMVGGSVYHWAYGVYVLFLFLVTYACLNWGSAKRIFMGNRMSLAIGMILIGAMVSPLAALYFEKDEIYPSARQIHRHDAGPQGVGSVIGVDYRSIENRSTQVGFGQLGTVTGVLTLNSANGFGNYAAGDEIGVWRFSKMATIFLLLGIFFGRHRFRWPLFICLCGSVFMWIGPQPYFGWLYKIIYFAFPPLWLTRHVSFFQPFCMLLMVAFVGLGVDRLYEILKRKNLRNVFLRIYQKGCRRKIFPFAVVLFYTILVSLPAYLVVFQSNLVEAVISHDWAIVLTGLTAVVTVYVALSMLRFVRTTVFCVPALLFPPIMILIVLEQGVLAVDNMDPPDTNCTAVCVADRYFEDFSWPRKAVQEFVLPERRNLGVNLRKSYLSYAPTIFKNNVALEDIMPPSPPPIGSGVGIDRHFLPTNFPLGLYHFWMLDYLRVYEIGEWQPKIFSALMGIGKPLVDFKTHYSLPPPPRPDDSSGLADQFWKKADGDVVSAILDHVVIIEPNDPLANDAVDISDMVEAVGNIAQARDLIKPLTKEKFNKTDGRVLPPGWVSYTQPGAMWSLAGIPAQVGPVGKALTIPVSKFGPNMVRFTTEDFASVPKGNAEVRVEVWVKSNNKTKDAVTVDIQTVRGVGPVGIKSYDNSGDWEKLVVTGFVDQSVDYIMVTLYVRGDATASVEFAQVDIDVVSLPSGVKTIAPILEQNFGIKDSSKFQVLETSFSPNKLELEVSADQPGVLIYRDLWTKDWEALVDGESVPLMKVDLAFKGVALPAGKHRVVLNYRPRPFIATFYIYLAGLIGGAVFFVSAFGGPWWARRKRAGEQEPSRFRSKVDAM